MKRTLFLFGILLIFILSGFEANAVKGKINTVVIDPGHGGRDPGAVGSKAKEKDIALAISLKLGNYIEENFPGVNVIYTRKTDKFVALYRRAEIANKNKADLFISIHCNANPSSRAYGTETFVMGLHRSQANLEVAKKENAAILYEDDYMETYDGFDPHSPEEANIIFNMYQKAYLENSLDVASLVQDQFENRAQRVNRGVKQAGFLVLYHVTMPGILIETGFISNPREEQYLMSETGQSHIASAVFRAFRDYKEEQERLYAVRKNNTNSYDEYNPGEQKGYVTSDTSLAAINQNEEQIDHNKIHEEIHEENKPGANKNEPIQGETESDQQNISFRVQIASTSEEKPADAEEFEAIDQGVDYYYHEGLYKYTVGNEDSLETAAKIQEELQNAGFKDAFVVAFLNDQRISPSEAIKLLREMKSDSQ